MARREYIIFKRREEKNIVSRGNEWSCCWYSTCVLEAGDEARPSLENGLMLIMDIIRPWGNLHKVKERERTIDTTVASDNEAT